MRFPLSELRETLRRMDLTPKEESVESMRDHVALIAEMRPYVERAVKV